MSDEPLVIVPMPPLVLVLKHREQAKGSPLSEEEVLAIRDAAPSIALPASEARMMAESRGYEDISLEEPWRDWQAVRGAL